MRFDERKPDHTETVLVAGFKVVVYSFGTGDEVLLCLNGGPGLPCDYLREPHAPLADLGYRVVAFDQLGCGNADKPKNKALWTIERYVDEVETVRTALDLGKVHLLGHSWGGWLGIEYGVAHPGNLKTLILENTCGDMPHLIRELDRLRSALGSETVKMMLRHEAEGTLDHPEYQAAITLLNYRHVCRLDSWPAPLQRSLDDWNMDVYGTMQGPNEFLHLRSGSPAVDAGRNSVLRIPAPDFDGGRRIQDGDSDGDARVDMGIDEMTASAAPVKLGRSSLLAGVQQSAIGGAVLPAFAGPSVDLSGRKRGTDSQNRMTVYAYDAAGSVISRTTADGVSIMAP